MNHIKFLVNNEVNMKIHHPEYDEVALSKMTIKELPTALLENLTNIRIKGVSNVVFIQSETPYIAIVSASKDNPNYSIDKKDDALIIHTKSANKISLIVKSNNGRVVNKFYGQVMQVVEKNESGGSVYMKQTSFGNNNINISGDYIVGEGDLTALNEEAFVFIALKKIPPIKTSGSCDLFLSDIEQDNLVLTLSGSSDVQLKGNIKKLTVHASGQTYFKGKGGGEALSLTASGQSEIELKNYPVECAWVTLSGQSDSQVSARKSIIVACSGMSDLTVYGNPSVRSLQKSGMSDITFKA